MALRRVTFAKTQGKKTLCPTCNNEGFPRVSEIFFGLRTPIVRVLLVVLLFFLMHVPYSRAFVINRGSCTSHAQFSSFCALLLVLRKFYQNNVSPLFFQTRDIPTCARNTIVIVVRMIFLKCPANATRVTMVINISKITTGFFKPITSQKSHF